MTMAACSAPTSGRSIDQVQACPEMNKSITALVSWLGVRIVEVPVAHDEPRGRSIALLLLAPRSR